jgi:3-oxoacyl-[acyl-carrier protein] reductase
MLATQAKRTYVVTGGTKGIGLATVNCLVRDGHRAIALARTEPNGEFLGEFVPVDLADANATKSIAEMLAHEYRVDGIVNNVGLVRPAAVEHTTFADLSDVLDLSLRPALQLAATLVPQMRDRQFGRIINISSVSALGMPYRSSYAAAKAALIAFTRTWALELAACQITVNAVAPGPTNTEMFRQTNPLGSDGERKHRGSVPLNRIAHPDEIAAAICFLLSDRASFITGQSLFVDGGASIGRLAI